MNGLELRDVEILRALLRVRYLTTRQINAAFFSCARVGRRRVHRLSEYDLIRPHTKGLPEALRYTAWRLTARGLDEVTAAFPDELVLPGVIDRVATGSLRHVLHREALAELYLKLVVPDRAYLGEQDLKSYRRWAAELRRRASAITWQPDGDVVLRSNYLGERTDVVPDAVVRSAALKRRVFVELDRSNKDLGRIRDGLERYMRVLRDHAAGGDTVSVLFVVLSPMRKANIKNLGRGLLEPLDLVVLLRSEATQWLRERMHSVTDPEVAAPFDMLHADARRAYVWLNQLDSVMRANGMRDSLAQEDPALMSQGAERMLALYRTLTMLEARGARP